MSMDALTAAALQSLRQEFLPKLLDRLKNTKFQAGTYKPDKGLLVLLQESNDLINLLLTWQNQLQAQQQSETPSTAETLSDEEAHRLLAEMDSPIHQESRTAESEIEPEMDDEEASRLLAEMDAPTHQESGTAESEIDPDTLKMLADLENQGAIDLHEYETKEPSRAQHIPSIEANEDFGPEWVDNEFSSDPDMLKEFLMNSDELMTILDDSILKLEQDPKDKENIEEIFRAAHTLKGAAGMFGFLAIERVMHRMENLFDDIRKSKLIASPPIIDVVLQGVDALRLLIEAVRSQTPSGHNIGSTLQALQDAQIGMVSTPKPFASCPPQPKPDSESSTKEIDGHAPEKPHKPKEQTSTIRVDLARLDTLVNLVGELVIDRTRFSTIEENIRHLQPQSKLASHMTETVQLFGRHLVEIQDIIMKLRMVPIGNALNKFPRVVRDLSRSLNKEVDLFIDGETTELDKTLVEQIGDPLIHLIRNACDHGIETPVQRKAIGKPSRGRVILSAYQEGNHITISISDDGKGMDPEKIRKKGIERGLIDEDVNLAERDIFNLIFEPGFSTAEKVTTISGRGVGMDVVKKQISKLKGMIDLRSRIDEGTQITIQLPLTLAIVQSLLIQSRDDVYALPLSSVIESIRIKPSDIQRVGDAEVIKLREDVLPLLHLDETLEMALKAERFWYTAPSEQKDLHPAANKRMQRRKERLFVVVVGSAERRFGIVVDSLLNQQEMVIKSLSHLMNNVPCFAGGAVLGNGEVVLVLDIPELEAYTKGRIRNFQNNVA